MTRFRSTLVALLVITTGIAARIAPALWTPFPFNPDGFRFVAQTERTAAAGRLALESIGSHGYGFPLLLSTLQLVTDTTALWLAQPTIAVIGAVPCLIAVVLVRRLAHSRGWRPTPTLVAAGVAGLCLATEGFYLRRTATVSYEVLGLLLVVVSAFALHRALATGRRAWYLVLGPCLVVLPLTHHLSTVMAALTMTALLAVHSARRLTPRRILIGLALVGSFWGYFAVYYGITRPPYVGDLAAKPGLFLAWLILLGAIGWGLQTASPRAIRVGLASVVAGGFCIIIANAVLDVFPGTATTHPTLLVAASPLVLYAALAVWGFPLATSARGAGPLVLALFVGPLVFVGFALTAGLSPEYRDFVYRGQTFLHLALSVAAALAVVNLGWPHRPRLQPALKVGLPVLLVACALVSMPIAFAGPPMLPYEGTTTTDEFHAITFADTHFEANWTSDDHLTRVGSEYYGAGVSPAPTYEWLRGGDPPACPTLVQGSWPAVGAQAFPADQIPVDESTLRQYRSSEQVVYTSGSTERHIVVHPNDTGDCA